MIASGIPGTSEFILNHQALCRKQVLSFKAEIPKNLKYYMWLILMSNELNNQGIEF